MSDSNDGVNTQDDPFLASTDFNPQPEPPGAGSGLKSQSDPPGEKADGILIPDSGQDEEAEGAIIPQ